jgi:hypothetical protein
MLILGSFWAVAGVTCVLFTVAWRASGAYAMMGVFWIALALLYLGGALQQHRRNRRTGERSRSDQADQSVA